MASTLNRGATCEKLLVLGNPGRGKSFLCNVIAGKRIFEHKFSAASVTHVVEKERVVLPSGSQVEIFNIPGLIEYDAAAQERNLKANKEAVDENSHVPACVLFVLGLSGGRVRGEDVEAFAAFARYCPVLREPSGVRATLFVCNMVDDHVEVHIVQRLLSEALGLSTNPTVCVLPRVQTDATEKDCRDTLLKYMSELVPTALRPAPGARLELSGAAARRELSAMKQQEAMMQADHEAKMKSITSNFSPDYGGAAPQRIVNSDSSQNKRERISASREVEEGGMRGEVGSERDKLVFAQGQRKELLAVLAAKENELEEVRREITQLRAAAAAALSR